MAASFLALLLLCFFNDATADVTLDSSSAVKSWSTKNATFLSLLDGSSIHPIFQNFSLDFELSFAYGFYRNEVSKACLFGMFWGLGDGNSSFTVSGGGASSVAMVWSANRNNPINGDASLRLTKNGLELFDDSTGRIVWSTNTSDLNGTRTEVTTMELTEQGNLVLLNNKSETVWQSFDYPTDTILPQQPLTGRKGFSNASAINTTEGSYFLEITAHSFSAYFLGSGSKEIYYVANDIEDGVLITLFQSFWRLEADGHLRMYKYMKYQSSKGT